MKTETTSTSGKKGATGGSVGHSSTAFSTENFSSVVCISCRCIADVPILLSQRKQDETRKNELHFHQMLPSQTW